MNDNPGELVTLSPVRTTAAAWREIARPLCVVIMCLTLCAGAIIEQTTGKGAPFWYRIFACGIVGEWCAERIVNRIRNKNKE